MFPVSGSIPNFELEGVKPHLSHSISDKPFDSGNRLSVGYFRSYSINASAETSMFKYVGLLSSTNSDN